MSLRLVPPFITFQIMSIARRRDELFTLTIRQANLLLKKYHLLGHALDGVDFIANNIVFSLSDDLLVLACNPLVKLVICALIIVYTLFYTTFPIWQVVDVVCLNIPFNRSMAM